MTLVRLPGGLLHCWICCNGIAGTWKVTKKFGKGGAVSRTYHKPYMLELLLAVLFFGYTAAAVWYGMYLLASFCWVMAWTFLLISCGDYLF
jgi:hypothetical protein